MFQRILLVPGVSLSQLGLASGVNQSEIVKYSVFKKEGYKVISYKILKISLFHVGFGLNN